MPRGISYVDNAYNRSLGRVGAPMGSMPVSRSSGIGRSSFGISHSTYVDNTYNRSLGRVGAPMGSMPVSRSSGIGRSSFGISQCDVDNTYNRSLGRVGAPMGSMPVSQLSGVGRSSFGSHSTDVDNTYNRSLGRVGAPMGSIPVSRSSGIGRSSLGSHSTYVDNTYNRSLDRVGAPMGSMPVSRSSGIGRSSFGSHSTDVDNTYNRSVGRVGAPMGSMSVSRSSSASSALGAGGNTSASHGTYVDNSYNRSVGRVGMPKGSMPISRSSSGTSATATATAATSTRSSGTSEKKMYVDNALNQRLGRVGLPVGSAPHSRKSAASTSTESPRYYVDNHMNRQLGRAGLLVGAMPVTKTGSKNNRKKTQPTHPMGQLYDQLLQDPEAGNSVHFPTSVPQNECDAMYESVMCLIRRMNLTVKWQETNQGKQPHTSLETVQFDGPVIQFEEIEIQDIKIGFGGFGDVYLAKWQGTAVALKKLRVQRVSKRRLKQFQEEVKVLSCLDHPCIVKFIGACVVTPNLAIVMEYMKKSLYEALHVEEVNFSDKEQQQILLHIVDGLTYLHGKSVAHCDMKSSNILLDDNEDGIVAKISDFGLSMMKNETETSQSPAKVQGVGTPNYSAPEVLSGEELTREAMYKADIYSMAVIAWEIICQEVPFHGLNIHQLKRRVLGGDVNLKIPDDIKVRGEVVILLTVCWMQDANKRPSLRAFREFIANLEGIG